MKIFKTILTIFLVVIIAIGGCGCMKSITHIDVTNYLSDKYDDTFFIDETISPGIDVKYYEYHCHSSKYPDKRFVVYKENGKYKDNYYGILIGPIYEQIISNELDKYYTDYKLYYNFKSNYFDGYFTDVNLLDEYLKNNPSQFNVNISVFLNNSNELNKENFENIRDLLETKLINFNISIALCNENDYLNLTEMNYSSVVVIKEFRDVVKGN